MHARITLLLFNGFVVLGGKLVKMFEWRSLDLSFGVFFVVLFWLCLFVFLLKA